MVSMKTEAKAEIQAKRIQFIRIYEAYFRTWPGHRAEKEEPGFLRKSWWPMIDSLPYQDIPRIFEWLAKNVEGDIKMRPGLFMLKRAASVVCRSKSKPLTERERIRKVIGYDPSPAELEEIRERGLQAWCQEVPAKPKRRGVEQLAARQVHNLEAAGSNPAPATSDEEA